MARFSWVVAKMPLERLVSSRRVPYDRRLCTDPSADRYNGFMWQTRTLEVRPDRLPPEYEPQPLHHPPPPLNRPPMFPFIGSGGPPPPPHFGPGPGLGPGPGPGPGPGHPGWHPSHHRPPMPFGPGPGHNGPHHHPMAHHMTHPGMSLSPHPPPHMQGGPPGRTHTPAPFGPNGMYQHQPLSSQNSGPHSFGSYGASPLAGSLTAGPDPLARPGSSHSHHLGPSPHMPNLALPRPPSPAGMPGPGSRPASSQGGRSTSSGEAHRHGLSGPLPPPPGQRPGHAENPLAQHITIDQGYVPHLEGLAQRRSQLGPPATLHDRVVFVSNVSRMLRDSCRRHFG